MAKEWQIKQGEKILGPFTDAQLQKLVSSGRVNRRTPIRGDENSIWMVAGRIPGLFPDEESSGTVENVSPSTPSPAKSGVKEQSGNAKVKANDDTEKVWHVGHDGKTFGPFTLESLKKKAITGKLSPTDLVWKPGLKEWIPANTVVGMAFSDAIEGQPEWPLQPEVGGTSNAILPEFPIHVASERTTNRPPSKSKRTVPFVVYFFAFVGLLGVGMYWLVFHQPIPPGGQQPGLQVQPQMTSETAIHNAVLRYLKETLDDPTVIVVRWGAIVPLRSKVVADAMWFAIFIEGDKARQRPEFLPLTANGITLRFRTKNRSGALEIKDFIFRVEKGVVVEHSKGTDRYVPEMTTDEVHLCQEYLDALPNGQGGGVPAQGGLGNDLGKIMGK